MNREFYDRLAAPYEADAEKCWRLNAVNSIITSITYIIYPILLVVSLFHPHYSFWKVLFVPLVWFVIVTIFRKVVNRKRPYEVWDVEPLIPRNKTGESFPSRHSFSIFMIAMVALYMWKPLGLLLILGGIVLAYTRVAGRVHYVEDVIVGALLGLIAGGIGFFV